MPEKMNEIIKQIKTMNLRLQQYGIMDKDMVESSFYVQFKIKFDQLLFDIQIQINEHVQASTMMLQGYNSYLEDYRAKDKPDAADYLKQKHDDMNNIVQDIAKKGGDDFGDSSKLVKHFDDMMQLFIEAQSMIIDRVQQLKSKETGIIESRNKCQAACRALKTEICSKLDFVHANAIDNGYLDN